MADADRVLEILINLKANKIGAEEAVSELNKVKSLAKATGDEGVAVAEKEESGTKTLILRKHELRAALHALGRAFPEVGHLARFMFNPITAGIGLVAVGISAAKKAMDDFNAKIEEAGRRGALSLGTVKDALGEIRNEAIRADKGFANAFKKFADASKEADGALNRQGEALLALVAVQEKLETLAAKDDAAKAKIKIKYAELTQGIKEQTGQKIAAAKEDEKAELISKGQRVVEDAKKLVGTRTEEQVAAELKSLPEKKRNISKSIEEVVTDIKTATDKYDELFQQQQEAVKAGYGAAFEPAVQEAKQKWMALEEVRTKAVRLKAGYEGEETRFTEAQAKYAERDKLLDAINSLTSEIREIRNDAKTKSLVGGANIELLKAESTVKAAMTQAAYDKEMAEHIKTVESAIQTLQGRP
jgi:hypothetical protein